MEAAFTRSVEVEGKSFLKKYVVSSKKYVVVSSKK